MARFFTRKGMTEAQIFFEETYRFPNIVVALAALAVGDVAITVSIMLSLG